MQGGAMSAAAAGEAAYSVGMKKSPLQPQPQPNAGVRLAYTHDGTAVFKHTPAPAPAYQPPLAYQPPPASSAPRQRPMGGNGAPPAPAISASADSPKRKRGRPRKYAPDGTMPLAVVPASQPAGAAAASAAAPALPPGFSSGLGSGRVVSPPMLSPPPPPPAATAISEDARQLVKKRGRPLGSANKKPRQVGTAAGPGRTGLKPHVITVQAGEDVASKVMSFSRNGWAVCILSANGAVSNVTLRQAASSGATVTYEGCFEILSLSGSYLLSESDGLSSRAGGLSVSLAGPDGRVLGGGVAGPLTAASPVQVVIGSFVAGGKKEPKQAVAIRIPGASSGSSGGPGSPPNQSAAGSFNTSSQPVLSNFSWK